MLTLARDLRFAFRSLVTARAFSTAVVLTLALGMTLCMTAMIVIKAYLLNDLPYPAADRLYWIRYSTPGNEQPRNMERLDWDTLRDVIEHPVAWDLDMFYLLGGEYAESAPGAWVTPGFVQGLGIRPALGHGFDDAAFTPGGPNQALISHRLWTTRFGRDAGITGRTFTAYVSDRPEEAETFTIVGVMPESFWHINPYTDILAPLRAATYPYLARLREGATPADAAARITSLVQTGATGVPAGWAARVESVRNVHLAPVRTTLRTVGMASVVVLLVGCANVAGLLLVRSAGRQREIAVRTALGAGRGALARMLTAEGLILAAAATAVSVVLSRMLVEWLVPSVQQQLGRSAPGGASAFALDGSVIAFAGLCGLCLAVVCSLIPILTAWGPRLLGALQSNSRTATAGPGSNRIRATLIAFEIAAALTLLSGAMLMLRSVGAQLDVDLGINGERVLNASLTLRRNRYPDAASSIAFYERMAAQVGHVPGVESVGLSNNWPLQQPGPVSIGTEGAPVAAARAAVHGVSPAYFETLGIPLRAGRRFTASDDAGSESVAMVSESLARRLWRSGQEVGSLIDVPQAREGAQSQPIRRRVIGVVRDVRQGPSDQDLSDVYVPLLQAPTRFAFVLVRTAGAPAGAVPAIRTAVRTLDPELALDRVRSMQTLIEASTARARFMSALLSALAVAAALLALVGVYGVIAYAVRQREREIAVRLAVGAAPWQVVRLFMRQGGRIIVAGLVLGMVATLLTTKVIESELFGVSPKDPFALTIAAAAFGLAGLFAVWSPARRAASTDPAVALRAE